jgi:hypothetical protein
MGISTNVTWQAYNGLAKSVDKNMVNSGMAFERFLKN